MKEKSIFDRIYQKDINLKFENLKRVDVSKNLSLEKDPSVAASKDTDVKEASDENLDAFLNLLYNNKNFEEVKVPTQLEKDVLTEKVLRNRIKAQNIREQIEDIKTEIIDKVKDKTYTLDISKSTNYKRASNDIFGGNKKSITYEDYLYLLELKEKIIIHEASDILGS